MIPVANASDEVVDCIASGELAPGTAQVTAAVEGASGVAGALGVAGFGVSGAFGVIGVPGEAGLAEVGGNTGVVGAADGGAADGSGVFIAPGRGDSGAEPSPRRGSPKPRGASDGATPAGRTIASI